MACRDITICEMALTMEYPRVCCLGGTLQGKFQENGKACRYDQCLDGLGDRAPGTVHLDDEHTDLLSVHETTSTRQCK